MKVNWRIIHYRRVKPYTLCKKGERAADDLSGKHGHAKRERHGECYGYGNRRITHNNAVDEHYLTE